ncbi:DUF2188 domain-containing protein [Amycolatopsis sp. CA-128772]|uniref:DUF2188 domain-containing protein n=1 Tax=Amycolatopsis sp. CA-128772 TaxID=2073159 RepID=UPI0018EE0705|nr:DUF2188 domain-containing protein [Amycolatopsis sp. CA-128772]
MKGDVETYHQNGQWHNKVEGTTDVLGSHNDKTAAVQQGRELAKERKVEHFIRNMDGKIGERNSYGNDPRNIPG